MSAGACAISPVFINQAGALISSYAFEEGENEGRRSLQTTWDRVWHSQLIDQEMGNPHIYRHFVAMTNQLISGYLNDEAQLEEVSTVWRKIWQPHTDGECFLNSQITKGKVFFSGDLNGNGHFFNLVYPLFIDMMLQPLEQKFLRALFELPDFKIYVRKAIKVGDVVNALFNELTGFPLRNDSCAYEMAPSCGQRFFDVGLSLDRKVGGIHRDKNGGHFVNFMSDQRLLSHELVHVFHLAKGSFVRHHALENDCWTDAEEQMTITGQCGADREEFSENAFACARGEMERVSHKHIPFTSSKNTQFLYALLVGCDGTANSLLGDGCFQYSYNEGLLKDFLTPSNCAQNPSKLIPGLQLIARFWRNDDCLDVAALDERKIARIMTLPLYQPKGDKTSDQFLLAMEQRRQQIYGGFQLSLRMCDLSAKLERIEAAMIDALAKTQPAFALFQNPKGPTKEILGQVMQKLGRAESIKFQFYLMLFQAKVDRDAKKNIHVIE
jgi:hypothetical protein